MNNDTKVGTQAAITTKLNSIISTVTSHVILPYLSREFAEPAMKDLHVKPLAVKSGNAKIYARVTDRSDQPEAHMKANAPFSSLANRCAAG